MWNKIRNISDKVGESSLQMWIVIAGVSVFLFITSCIVSGNQVSILEGKLQKLEESKRMIVNELTLKKSSAKQVETTFKRSATGMDDIRASKDEETAETYFRPAFTWDSGEEYDDARNKYLKDMKADSVFLSVFLPENGTIDNYNYVDVNNLNSQMKTFDSYVINIDGNAYTYLAFVETSSNGTASSEKGSVMVGSGIGKAIIQYTILNDKVSNVNAWTLQS